MQSHSKFQWYGVYFLFLILCFLFIFLHSILSPMPKTVLSLPANDYMFISSWYPQGWGFYSKDPTEEGLYIIDATTKEPSTFWPHNSKENLFGLQRTGRSQGIEAGLLKSFVPEDAWIECEEDPIQCGSEINEQNIVEVNNPNPYPTICNDQLIILQEPVPWAWSDYKDNINMPSQVVRVKITCFDE